MRDIKLSDDVVSKLEMLKDIFSQLTGEQFKNDEEFIEFLIDGYLQSIQPQEISGGCCGGGCGCSH